jgi:hypothetical protein
MEFGRTFEATVLIIVEPTTVMPSLYLGPVVLQAITELGAGLDIAVHVDLPSTGG